MTAMRLTYNNLYFYKNVFTLPPNTDFMGFFVLSSSKDMFDF